MNKSNVMHCLIIVMMTSIQWVFSLEDHPLSDFSKSGKFEVKLIHSGITYPDEGDEKNQISYRGLTYHAHIHHLEMNYAPHVSTAYFWRTKKLDDVTNLDSEVAYLPPFLSVLERITLKGLFFATDEGRICGFYLINDVDTKEEGDDSSSGVLANFSRDKIRVYSWSKDKEKIIIHDSEKKVVEKNDDVYQQLLQLSNIKLDNDK